MQIGRLKIAAGRWPWQGTPTSMGRFGGGWRVAFGARVGWHLGMNLAITLVIDLIFGQITISWLPKKTREAYLVVSRGITEFMAFCKRNELIPHRDAIFVRDAEMLFDYERRTVLFVGRWQERDDWRRVRDVARSRRMRESFRGDGS